MLQNPKWGCLVRARNMLLINIFLSHLTLHHFQDVSAIDVLLDSGILRVVRAVGLAIVTLLELVRARVTKTADSVYANLGLKAKDVTDANQTTMA